MQPTRLRDILFDFGHWFAKGVEKVLDRLFTRYDIGRGTDVYMTRWSLFGQRYGKGHKVFLHKFHRSDSDEALHDHPWSFMSIIIAGGYYEWTDRDGDNQEDYCTWYPPGSILRRPPEWKHRVELIHNRTAWTCMWCSDKVKSWGFFCKEGYKPWRIFSDRQDAGKSGCGSD